MILEVYDKDTNNRVDIIRTFTFIQYTKYFNDIGTFTVKVPVEEKSLPNLMKTGNYILFDEDVMGIIKYAHKESIDSAFVEIKGYTINHILTYRSFLVTTNYSGEVVEIIRNMVNDLFISNNDARRNIGLISLEDEYPESEEIEFQNTGETVAEEIRYLNLQYNFGYDLVAEIQKYDETQDRPTNIKGFEFRTLVPEDHTMFNQVGNTPVVFSADMNNLSDLIYENDDTEYCNVAIVAGEDYGKDRKIVETGDILASGINRIELYVDARDIQSGQHEYVTEDEIYTKEEIDEMIDSSVSPTAYVERITGGARITITDKDGTTTATVNDGQNGQNGQNGQDGYSPTARVDQTTSGAIITVTDRNGTTTATITNGADGAQGPAGDDYILTNQDKQDIATIVYNMIGSADTLYY